jgi:hypothetical protein
MSDDDIFMLSLRPFMAYVASSLQNYSTRCVGFQPTSLRPFKGGRWATEICGSRAILAILTAGIQDASVRR